MTAEALLEALRAATRAQHEEIESVLQLMQPIALPRYTAIVAGFHAFLAQWEPRIEAALPSHLQAWWRPRRRGALAADDLQHLQVTAGAHVTAVHVPHVPHVPAATAEQAVARIPLHGLPHTFGSMYVIEGSALGGQVIAPRLERELRLGPGRGASYFHGFGRDTGGMWRDFRLVLAREVEASDDAVRQACRSARATFQALGTVFRALAA